MGGVCSRRKQRAERTATMEISYGNSQETEDERLRGLFVFMGEYGRIVCKGCKVAVEPGIVVKHLRAKHKVKSIKQAERVGAKVVVEGWHFGISRNGEKPVGGGRPQRWLEVFDCL